VTASQVPLRPEQIKAAQAIYSNYTEDWRRTDAALADLKEKMPGFKSSAALVKAAAVNSLYGTNVYAISAAARRVEDLLDGKNLRSAGPELVEEMASIRLPEGKVRHCPSFASKFAHFFIDYDRFPIYDSYAVKMLRDHLGHDALASEPTYMAFEKAFRTLAREVDLGSDTRQLDRYLWIVGEYREWLKNPKSVHSELRRQVFETDPQPPELKDAARGVVSRVTVNLKRRSHNRYHRRSRA